MNDRRRQGELKPENARVLSQMARLTMSETEFWGALLSRIILSGQLPTALGYCDWLEVKRYCIGPPDARIEGLVGFVGRGPVQVYFGTAAAGGISRCTRLAKPPSGPRK